MVFTAVLRLLEKIGLTNVADIELALRHEPVSYVLYELSYDQVLLL